MTRLRLILRSLTWYWPTQLGVAIAAAVATAVLVGALVVGDSVRASLRQMALARLGDTHLSLTGGDRFFTTDLADRIDKQLDTTVAPVLELRGLASARGGQKRAANVHVLGIDDRFWALGDTTPPTDKLAVSRRLADQLDVEVGDRVLLRIAKPSALPRDLPLGADKENTITLAMSLGAIVGDDQFGRYSQRADQIPPLNAFVPIDKLGETAQQPGRANTLLVGPGVDIAQAQAALRKSWSPADVELSLTHLEKYDTIELRSRRVFIDDAVVDAAAAEGHTPVLTYFVNQFRHGDKTTPYSMVTGRPGVGPDKIIITDWLADDLDAAAGDTIDLTYYVIGDEGGLIEQTTSKTVSKIVPVEAPGGDRRLMPDFPGLADVDDALDWEPGIPIDLQRIRDKDETYWDEHRGAPKAFVNLDWAQQHWSNRFGKVTALRWADDQHTVEDLTRTLQRNFDPASVGLRFTDVRTPALAASQQGTDFGGLFIGLSFFLILAALLLTALMFAFGVEQRTGETGLLRAVGFTPARVRNNWLIEGGLLAGAGAIIGLPLGLVYTRWVLKALNAQWQDAVAQATLTYHATTMSITIGVVSGIVAALAAMAWTLRRQSKRNIVALMSARFGFESKTGSRGRWSMIIAIVCFAGAVTLLAVGLSRDQPSPGLFFGIGALLLIGGLAACGYTLRGGSTESITMGQLAWRNSTRRRGRSLATITMLACGAFLIVSINAFRQDPTQISPSATGGFELFAQTTIPLHEQPEGFDMLGMRVRAGDEASCLNLNQPQTPPLLAVDPVKMNTTAFNVDWSLLESPDGDAMPALVEASVAQWIMKKSVGDTITYIDENGNGFEVKIAGLLPPTVLQGFLIVDQQQFEKRYPSISGASVLLAHAPEGKTQDVKDQLERELVDYGISAMTTQRRMMLFSAVQNTYLSIFSLLGGLGLGLGSIGLGLVVMRNVLERRGELALMRALGFTRRRLRRLVLREHVLLLIAGLIVGIIAAAVSIVPTVSQTEGGASLTMIVLTLGGVLVSGLVWTALATYGVLRGPLIEALRKE